MSDLNTEMGQTPLTGQVQPQYPPPPPAYMGPTPVAPPLGQPKTSGLAIASLVLGLLWIYGLGSVLAIIFSAVAKKNIRESNGWVTGNGMAIAGLVLGIIGVAITLLIIIAAASSNASVGLF